MPPAAAARRSRTSHMSKLSAKLSRPYAPPLRPDSEESDDTGSEDAHDQSLRSRSWQDLDISELDDPMDYGFQCGDRVWVRTQEHNWRLGKVVKGQPRARPLTRNSLQAADYYQVQFGMNGKLNTRKYFAPMNGEMKPDTFVVRGLLLAGGWISDDSAESPLASGSE